MAVRHAVKSLVPKGGVQYNDPAFLAHRHGLGEQAKAAGTAITAALNAIATKATAPP
jgi:hypothetical protein